METIMKGSKQSSEMMDRLGYQDLLSQFVQNGLPEGGNSKSSFQLQGKAEPVVGTGRFLENSMSVSRQDTSGAAEGPLAEPDSAQKAVSGMDGAVVENRASPSVPTPKSVGTGIMRGRALRTEDLKIDGFPRSLLKSRGMGTKARTDVQSPMLSFRSLLEGAISASGVQPTTSAQGIAESGLQSDGLVTSRTTPESYREGKVLSVEGMLELREGERNFALRAHDSSSLSGDTVGDSVPHVSYSSLLQAQLSGDPVEVRADSSCKTSGTLHLNVEARSPPVKLQLQSTEVEGGFLALLNQTTRLLAPVAQRPSSPRADGGRISGVHFSDKLLQAVAGDASPSTDASGTPLPEEGGDPLAVNESRSAEILSDRVAIDFSETATVPASPVLTTTEEDVSPADVMVADSASIEDVMSDAQLFEELSRGLAIEESKFAENASNMGAVESPEAAAALTSPVPTGTQQSVPREEVVVADSVSTDDKALDVQLSEEPSGALGVDESRLAHNVRKRDITDSLEASAAPEVPVSTRLDEADLPAAGVERENCVAADSISGEEKASDVQPPEEVPQALVLDESRSGEIVSERDPIDSLGAATVPASPVLVRREEDVPRVEVVGTGSMGNDWFVSDEPSQALALDELRNTDIVIEGDAAKLSEAAAELASLMPIRTREDVPLSEASVEKVGLCGDAVGHSEQSQDHLLSSNRSDEQVSDERIQCPSQRLETKKLCADGRDGLIDAGTTLVSSCQAGLKQMGDADADSVDAETILEWSCKAGMKGMEDVDRDIVGQREDNLCEGIAAGTFVECSRQAVPKQTENQNALFVEEQNGEICDAHVSSSTENVSFKSKADIDSTKVVLEKELDIYKVGPVHSIHTELVEDDLNVNALVEKSSSLLPPNGHMVRVGPHSTPEHWGSISPCAEGRSEPLDAGSVVGSSWQAVSKHTGDREGMVEREQDDSICHIEVLEDMMGQHAGGTEEHLMGDGSGPQRSCVGSVEITSITASPHVNGSLLVAECIHTDGGDHTVSRTEEKVEQERILGGLEGSNQVIKQPEVEQHSFDTLADELTEKQMVTLPYSESQAVNQGFVASRTSYESEELPSSELVVVEPDLRNEEERVPKGLVGEIVNIAMDSGNAGVRADQALSISPDAVSEGLRQVILRDSDATVSESLESVQVSGAEFGASHQEAGKEVQSPLVMKSKDRRHVGDLENRHVSHPDDLEENEEQPYASSLNGTVNDQLVGAEVRSFKKKGRPRVYNHEKALHGTGRPHLQPSGSKRKRHLQYAGNRWRRNRHIDPDQPVPVYIEGRDEGFEEADDGAFSRWLANQDKGNSAPSPSIRKRVRKHGSELLKPVIAIPSFRVVADYEERQQEVETRRKVEMQQHLALSTHEMQTLMISRTVRASDYDMDDEDEGWLHAWNKRLARGGLKQPISEDKFEEMIEYFERMYAQMEVDPAGDVPGFLDCQKSSAHSMPGSSLPSTSPSGLGCLSTNPATPGIPVPENAPALNPSRIRSGRSAWTGGLKVVSSLGKQVVVSSVIRDDNIGGESASPDSTVLFHTLNSENKRNIYKSVADTVTGRPSEDSLQKSFKPPAERHASDDCCICNGGEDDEDNPVYTCKRCLIHVHQSCYGIREKFRDDAGRVIAPPSWCCRKCEAVAVGTAQPNVSCVLCRKRGGALKPTVAPRKWAHVACALYTNETFFVDPDAMEPIDGIAAVAARAQDRQDRCGLCGVMRGICSLCSVKGCRAPFHISCGVSQGASFELRQSKQKVVGVRSFCPRHARRTPMDSAPSAGLKEGHLVSSSTTSGATASATASGSISTASSMDHREEWPSRQNTSCMDGSFVEPARQAATVGTYVADLTDNVVSVTGKGTEDAGRGRPNGLRFTLKRRWDESCTPVSEDGVSSDLQKKAGNGRGVTGDKIEAPGCKSTWHVVEPGQKLKKIKFKFGKLAQSQDPESSPTLVQQERIGCEDPEAEKIKEVMPAVGEASGDAIGNDRDTAFVNGLSEDRFVKEVKELSILEQAMKSGVAPVHIMREAFVYWRAKRAGHKGFLLCELNHKQWSKFQGIFNKDSSDEGNLATGKLCVPLALQPSPVSTEKMLGKAKELREQLDRVRSMAQMVVQREKLKYNQQLVLITIASAELNRAESISEERRCVWCPSTKTLLKCGTCPRSFCFNCFKHRKGFGVKGWMAASKQAMYSCKYCRELLSNVADLSNNLDPAAEEFVDAGLASTPVVASEPVDGMVSTPAITCEPLRGVREKGTGKGRDEGWGLQGFDNPISASLTPVGGGTIASAKGLGIGRGKGNRWTASDNAGPGSARRGSENGANNQSKPSELEAGLNKFLSIANDQMEHSSFETTLRRLKILQHKTKDANQEQTVSAEIASGDIEETADVRASGPVIHGLEPSTVNGGNVSVPLSPASGPALLVYKKNRRLVLSASSESPPSAYDFSDELNYSPSTGLENGTSVRIMSPSSGVIAKRLEIGGLERI